MAVVLNSNQRFAAQAAKAAAPAPQGLNLGGGGATALARWGYMNQIEKNGYTTRQTSLTPLAVPVTYQDGSAGKLYFKDQAAVDAFQAKIGGGQQQAQTPAAVMGSQYGSQSPVSQAPTLASASGADVGAGTNAVQQASYANPLDLLKSNLQSPNKIQQYVPLNL